MSYVAGYTVAHDVSARDWQMKKNGKQWLLGKTFDTFCPLGPALVTTPSISGSKGNGEREKRVHTSVYYRNLISNDIIRGRQNALVKLHSLPNSSHTNNPILIMPTNTKLFNYLSLCIF